MCCARFIANFLSAIGKAMEVPQISEAPVTALVGEFLFPDGEAYCTRAIGLGKMLRNAGGNVWIQGTQPTPSRDSARSLVGSVEDLHYQNLASNPHTANRLSNLGRTITRGLDACRFVSKHSPTTTNVILKSSSSRYLIPFLCGAWRSRWRLFVDVVEWYDYSHLPSGRFGPRALDCHLSMTALVPQTSGVIAISTFLENYYRQRGVRTIRIPQIVDLNEAKWNFNEPRRFDSSCTNLVYAGVPGRKDLVGDVVRAVSLLVGEGIGVKLHLIGPTRNEMRDLLANDASLVNQMDGSSLVFHGRVSAAEIPTLLARADYSVLLRPNARYAQAGFPTKLTESFAAGVPMIGNITGDIGLYLRNGETGWVVPDASVEALVATLKQVVRVSPGYQSAMRAFAKAEAGRSFDLRNYVDLLREFIGSGTTAVNKVIGQHSHG